MMDEKEKVERVYELIDLLVDEEPENFKWIAPKTAMEMLGVDSYEKLDRYVAQGHIKRINPRDNIHLYDKDSIEAFLSGDTISTDNPQ